MRMLEHDTLLTSHFDCCLGGTLDQHKKLVPKPKPKSKKKQERDNLRAQLHQQRLQGKNSSGDGSLNLQLSSLSSHNESEMKVASPSFSRTASSSSSPNKDNSKLETRNKKSYVSDSLEEDYSAANNLSSGSHLENVDTLSENLTTNNSHLESVDFIQTSEGNVDLDDDVDVTISDFHNGLFSSTVEKGNNESSCKDSEVQLAQQISSTPEPEKMGEASLNKNSV